MKVAIVIGHNKIKQGQFSPYIVLTEYNYHKRVASMLKGVDLYFRNNKENYPLEIDDLCKRLNAKEYDLVLSLHFNSYDKNVQGSECWAYYDNKFTKSVGQDYLNLIEQEYRLENRGVKLITKINERGGQLFFKCKHPVLLLEPCFGDEKQSEVFKDAKRYANILQSFIDCL